MRTITAAEHLSVPTRLADQPHIWAVDDFIDADTAAAALAVFSEEAFLAENADHYGWDSRSFAAEIMAARHPVLAAIMARVEAAVGHRSAHEPTFRFRWYNEGQGHPPHTDAYTFEDTRLSISTLIGLACPEAGGETRFPDALPEPVAVAPRLGRLVAWTSTTAGGVTDPYSRHDGAVVIAGTKGILLGFLYLEQGAITGDLVMKI